MGEGSSSRSRLSLNKITIRIISTVNCYFRLHSPKNWEFRMICQLATCDDCLPCLGLGLPPYTIITHSVKRRQSVEPVCVIVSHAHLFVSGYCLCEFLRTFAMYCHLLKRKRKLDETGASEINRLYPKSRRKG
ncbi:hypothetical protein TNCV_971471 [Trichonephila clavipes]|nr:hypothetical protein TNCV_971471 [Trichonephila clavipes]